MGAEAVVALALKASAELEAARYQASTSRHPVPQLPLATMLAPADIPQATTERLYQPSRALPTAKSPSSLHCMQSYLAPTIIPQNLPLNIQDGARISENGLKLLPSRRNPVPSSLQPLPGVRDVNRRCHMAFTGVALLQGPV